MTFIMCSIDGDALSQMSPIHTDKERKGQRRERERKREGERWREREREGE